MSRSPISAKSPTHVTLGGRSLLAFVGTDYLGLSAHEKVLEACREGLERYGLSASASRVTSGTYEAHVQLEEALAEFLGLESALVLPSGDLANQALLESMEGELDRILIDADSHTSLVRAARANGAPRHDYGPGDPTRLLALCDRFRGERLAILTDAVFPAKGRLAPIAHLLRYAPPKALVVVDDSHGMGVLDKRGRGTLAAFGTPSSQVVVTFSLAKSLGAFGGALVGPAQVIETVRRRSEVYQGGTALPPAVALAARTALGILEAEPERVRRLHRNIR
ncbi:MAG TPA: pyridoxal phosphate-dependent aminotransferase family protein, partial [Planctomycetota bacterium]|nr:pyridoxal phosphate-dependent aminotransferase family protein [Planctomycetota bacterium]